MDHPVLLAGETNICVCVCQEGPEKASEGGRDGGTQRRGRRRGKRQRRNMLEEMSGGGRSGLETVAALMDQRVQERR